MNRHRDSSPRPLAVVGPSVLALGGCAAPAAPAADRHLEGDGQITRVVTDESRERRSGARWNK